jgi:hypothetical protein
MRRQIELTPDVMAEIVLAFAEELNAVRKEEAETMRRNVLRSFATGSRRFGARSRVEDDVAEPFTVFEIRGDIRVRRSREQVSFMVGETEVSCP